MAMKPLSVISSASPRQPSTSSRMPWRCAVTSASTPSASMPLTRTLRTIFTDEALPGLGPSSVATKPLAFIQATASAASAPATSIGALMPCLKKPPMTATSM